MLKKPITLLIVALYASSIYAGGFQIGQNGHRNIGLGLSGTATCNDASSVFYNPGALTITEGKYSFSLGASLAFSYFAYHASSPSDYSAQTENPANVVPYFYFSAKITKRLKAGFGVYAPYGAINNWGNSSGWAGKYLIQRYDLNAVFLQPTLSYKIGEFLGIGAGFIFAIGNFGITRAIPVQSVTQEGQVKLKGSTTGIGFNAGIKVVIAKKINIGLTYISQIMLKFRNQEAEFIIPQAVDYKFPPKNRFNLDFPLPALASFGISYDLSKKVMLTLQCDYTFWSVNDSMKISFENTTADLADNNPAVAMKWRNTYTIRGGVEYKANEKLAIRAGGYYDQSPIKDGYLSPLSIGGNLYGITAGLSFKATKKLTLDGSFHFFDSFKREGSDIPNNFNGIYKIRAYFIGIGFNYNL